MEYGDSQPLDKIGQYEIMHDIYDRLSASNMLWRPEVYLKDALSTISEAKRANLSPNDFRKIAESNKKYISDHNKIVTNHLAGVSRISKDVMPNFEGFYDLQKHKINKLRKHFVYC